jgi:Na+/H+ antiporter NhaD/arsenite permease-like protein
VAPHRRLALVLLLLAAFSVGAAVQSAAAPPPSGIAAFPPSLESYGDAHLTSLPAILAGRVRAEPFNLIASLIFLCAIIHTLLANSFTRLAHLQERRHREVLAARAATGELPTYPEGREPVSFSATILHFFGEVEAVFGIWAAILLGTVCLWFDREHVAYYISTVNYAEPVFVVVIMCIAATRPVVMVAERGASLASRLGGGTPSAWWLAILCLLPPLGSFITEPAAMTIAAMLLSEKIFALEPSARFKYATLGLLFVDISVGGTLTHFAAPPVLMVASAWKLDTTTMFMRFGWKALVGIAICNGLFFLLLRHEFSALASRAKIAEQALVRAPLKEPVPWWVTIVHLLFVAFTVAALHSPPLVVMGFLFFLAFTEATRHHQYEFNMRSPLLVGLFLAALVTHGGFQRWWIQPVLSSLGELQLFVGSIVLTAFNDNAAITYLASLVPSFDSLHAAGGDAASALQYAVLAGAVTGGGLTIIANAPNPAGQAILSKHFRGGVSPAGLLAGALLPTLVLAGCLWLLRGV